MSTDTDAERVDSGELWSMDEVNVETEVYVFYGKANPYGSSAVAKAKKQFAADYDVDYNRVTGIKIGSVRSRDAGAIVAVFNWPEKKAREALPW